MANRNGQRKTREQNRSFRKPELGYYLIITDTKETEKNYFDGIKNKIPSELQDRLVLKTIKTETKNLIDEAQKQISLHPQYCVPWIIFDRDQVQDFDEIIRKAKENGINVGWSNPCIEIWFHAYWETMPAYIDSQNCCSGFDSLFTKKVGHPYNKNDTQIYNKICCYGNESKAIKYAKTRHTNYDEKAKPSKMNPCTTVYLIVEEINSKL